MAEATGLQQAEQAFQSMLTGGTPDNQQQLDEQIPEETEAEIEAEESEIEAEVETEEVETEEVEAEDAESQPQYHQIKLNGELYEITTDEALAGYQRQQDYTKKTQAIAEEKKQIASGTGSS